MGRRVVELANFNAGEYGLLGEAHAPQGSFTASNIVRLVDGSLCARSGLVDLAPTSIPAGAPYAFGYNSGQGKAWFVTGNQPYSFSTASVGAAVTTLTGTIASTPTTRVKTVAEQGQHVYVTNYGDKTYQLDLIANTTTALAGSPGGRCCVFVGDRLFVASTASNGNRLHYSAAADATSWPAPNYIDIGYGFEIVYLGAQRDRVVIVKSDGSWWQLSGVPGVNDVLRFVGRTTSPGPGTEAIHRTDLSGDGRIWFSQTGADYPAVYVGTPNIGLLPHLSLTRYGDTFPDTSASLPKVGATGLQASGDFLFTTGVNSTDYDKQGLLLSRGTWTKHVFAKNISGFIDGRYDTSRRAYLCDGANPPKFYSWSYDMNRPAFSGKTFESRTDAGTAFTASVTLPLSWVNSATPVEVSAVGVEFTSWNHGFGGNNTFTVDVTPVLRDGGSLTTVSKDYSVAAASAATSGTVVEQTKVFDGLQAGNAFRVTVSALVGVAIRRVFLILETHDLVEADSA